MKTSIKDIISNQCGIEVFHTEGAGVVGSRAAIVVLGLLLATTLGTAQIGIVSTPGTKRPFSQAAKTQRREARVQGSPSYNYTLLNFPGTLTTFAICINKGATTSKTYVVGGYGTAPELYQAGFLARVSGKKTVAESYQSVSYPHVPEEQLAECVNDSDQIVGTYLDSSGLNHGYERSGGKFIPLDVPFAGAIGTFPVSINNSGEVVGAWTDSEGNDHGFTLIGGAYNSFDYPGGTQTEAADINSAGDIVGTCYDASGVGIGFLLSGGTYTPIEYSGAVETFVSGINDSGVIVGSYCTTSECETSLDGIQNFLLNGSVYTPITIIPGEVYSIVVDINNNGVLVGYYLDAAGVGGSFIATP
jgi:hypothetical protein